MQSHKLLEQKEALLININKLITFSYNRNIISSAQFDARRLYVEKRISNSTVQFARAYRNMLLVELKESRATTPSQLHVDHPSSSALLFIPESELTH